METNHSQLTSKFKMFTKELQNLKLNYNQSFFQLKDTLRSLQLFQFFDKMPKGVLNHIHFPANVPLDTWIEILSFPEVIYNRQKKRYSVLPINEKLPKKCKR